MKTKIEVGSMNGAQHQDAKRLKREIATVSFVKGHLDGWKLAVKRAKAIERSLKETIRAKERELRELRAELKREKADSIEMLNNQSETIGELQKRAVPEGWVFNHVSKRDGLVVLTVERGGNGPWTWSTGFVLGRSGLMFVNRTTSNGSAATFNEAIKQAEKAGKKVRR